MAYFDRKDDLAFVRWAFEVKKRARFTCAICERQGVELNAHHIRSWDAFIEDRYDLSNGICLCSICHKHFHELYGYGKNDNVQFDQFEQLVETFKEAIHRKIRVESATKEIISKLDGYVKKDT